MRVIKDMQPAEDDWQWLQDPDEPEALPGGDVIVPFRYWIEHHTELQSRDGRLTVCIDGEDETEEVARHLDEFPELIALDFPAFKDGRCYSHARLLRERYGYRGELRAVGDVLRDQLFFMRRCGIDTFALRSDKDMADALKAFEDFTVTYQTAADGAPPIDKVRGAG